MKHMKVTRDQVLNATFDIHSLLLVPTVNKLELWAIRLMYY